MKAIIITSDHTYDPTNYDTLILGIAEIPEIYGLIVVRTKTWSSLGQGIKAILTGTAPRLGWQLVKNFFSPSLRRRRRRYESLGKQIWITRDLSSPSFLKSLEPHGIDLLINTRNQTPLSPSLLRMARLGGIHLHPGLLPEQKGVMCDFWAHLEKTPCGFTLHEINPLKHDGAIIRRVQVPRSTESFLEYRGRAQLLELAMLRGFFQEIRETGQWQGASHFLSIPFRHRKNPRAKDFENLRSLGVKI